MVGYDSRNKDKVGYVYRCCICALVLRDPVQLLCGHRSCQSCINDQKGVFIKCQQCDQETLKTEIFIDKGVKNDMQTLNISCSLCEWTGVFRNYQEHLDTNHSHPTCDCCHETFNQLRTSCENMQVHCDLLSFGCNEQILQKDLSKHYLTEKHQCVLVKAVLHQIKLAHSMKKRSDRRRIEDNASSQPQRLSDIVNEFRNIVQILKTKMKQILSQTSTIRSCFEGENPREAQDCATSHNGILLLKINHIKSRLNDASSDVITSAPFYTSSNGYKMCARVYLNGNGSGQSTHISVFLVVMRGDYDAILTWPVDCQVIFSLYDPTNQQNHIIHSFQSDANSRSFHRPESELNIGSGICEFFPKSVIQQENSPYVCEDSIYIKIMVRKNAIPASILPYAMNIDHALPLHIHEDRIREEIERNESQSFKLILSLKPK